MPLLLKFAITAFLVVAISEVVRISGRWGAVLAALPMVTVLAMTWMHVEAQPTARIAEHARLTFWYVLPTLPMFLLLPWMLERGHTYWVTLGACVLLTAVCFGITVWIAKQFGVALLG